MKFRPLTPLRIGFRGGIYGLVILALLFTSIQARAQVGQVDQPDAGNKKLFLPIAYRDSRSYVGTSSVPIMLGMYPESWWQWNGANVFPIDIINNLFKPTESWSGKRISLAGVFHSIEQSSTIGMLTTMWDNGYTPFVNLSTNVSSADIANGARDSNLHEWARNLKSMFANGGQRMLFIAPLQEMNYPMGLPYTLDPYNYKRAYRHIRDIFAAEGVSNATVRWVFAPNGYSRNGEPGFESYYPGDDVVDVVSFSSYNFGYSPYSPYGGWSSPRDTFQPYLDRMRAMAPSKPIFIAQTATTAYASAGNSNAAAKNQWIQDTYNYLASYPGVLGILYYDTNLPNDYDWAFYLPGKVSYQGYVNGVANGAFGYVAPNALMKADLTIH